MQDVLVPIPAPPVNTLSFDTTVYVGKNQIRRNVGHSVSLYEGGSIVDRFINVSPNQVVVITEPLISAIYLQTDMPLQVLVNTQWVNVNKLLVIDYAVTALQIVNNQTSTANTHLTYITP